MSSHLVLMSDSLNLYFRNPKEFTSRYLTKNAPHVVWVAWLAGAGGVIRKFTNDVRVPAPAGFESMWLQILVFGALAGAATYFISGTINYYVQRWAKGTATPYTSRNITVFALLPTSILLVLYMTTNAVLIGNEYLTERVSPFDSYFLFLSLLGLAWSMYFSYTSFRKFGMKKIIALTWFIVLPIIFYSLIFLVAIELLGGTLK